MIFALIPVAENDVIYDCDVNVDDNVIIGYLFSTVMRIVEVGNWS